MTTTSLANRIWAIGRQRERDGNNKLISKYNTNKKRRRKNLNQKETKQVEADQQ